MSLDQPISDSKLITIIEKVLQRKGIDLNRYKITFLKRRLEIRMRIRGITDYSKYALILNDDPTELSDFFQSLSINVTQFFRDTKMFQLFSDTLIPQIISGAKSFDHIKIWSAGCASGEEPYSIAALFRNALGNSKGPSVEITATDVSKKAIEFAKSGIYDPAAFKDFPPNLFSKFFHPMRNNNDLHVKYEALPEIKQMIDFRVDDLLSNALQTYDVIFCRNVLIYYTKEAHDLIFAKFYKSLKPSGYLILGMDETMLGTKAEKLFSLEYVKERIYKRSN